jgi:YfiH family protein
MSLITFDSFNMFTNIAHFCTDREGGVSVGNFASFNLSPFSSDNPKYFNENLQTLSKKIGVETEKIIIPFQTHGTKIREIDPNFLQLSNEEKSANLNGVDALITRTPNVCIGLTTADCVPLLFYDPQKNAIAVAHAGWRGTCARISEKTVQSLVENYNSDPADIKVVIGPSISAEAYQVGEEVVQNFENAGFDLLKIVKMKDEAFFLDLRKANQLSLEKAGIHSEYIEISGICTFTQHEKYFSARRLGIKSGRMLTGIMLIE